MNHRCVQLLSADSMADTVGTLRSVFMLACPTSCALHGFRGFGEDLFRIRLHGLKAEAGVELANAHGAMRYRPPRERTAAHVGLGSTGNLQPDGQPVGDAGQVGWRA